MSKSEIVGEWFAEYSDSYRTIQWALDFDSNKKGNYQRHRISDGYVTWANFTWKISGGRVICTGVFFKIYNKKAIGGSFCGCRLTSYRNKF